MILNKYITIFLLIIIIGSFNSCSDYLEKFPLDQPSDVTFYSTEAEITLAVNAIYSHLHFMPGIPTPFQHMLSTISDINWERDQNSNYQRISQGLVTSQNTMVNEVWDDLYSGIGKCNQLLVSMERAKDVTDPEIYERIAAEARFFRAYFYHLLINLYGDVPFVTEPLDIFDAELPRTSKSVILEFIHSELDAAISVLPTEYPANEKGRVTKGAALAIKARVALFNEQWSIAASSAKAVMDLGIYQLYPDYQELFTYAGEQNSEGIFTIQFSRQNELTHWTPKNLWCRLSGGWSNKVPPQALVDAYQCIDGLRIDQSPLYEPTNPFENRDPRMHASIVVPGSEFRGYIYETHPDSVETWSFHTDPPSRIINLNSTHAYASFSGYGWRKFTDEAREFGVQCELDMMLVRYAEVLLIYAEAKLMQGQVDASVFDAINQVRLRVDMPEVSADLSETELMNTIRYERKVEFAFEGLRFFDIRRWEIAEHVMPGKLYGRPLKDYEASMIPAFDEYGAPRYESYAEKLRQFDTRYFDPSRDYLWPIPQKEIDINSNLVQNPNY